MQLMDKSKSPLTKAEKKQETLRQYLELQSMATEKSLHRVKALQGKLDQDDLPAELRNSAIKSDIFLSPDGLSLETAENITPSQNFVLSADGKPVDMPLDIQMKSVAELKKLGFSEVMSMDFKPNKRSGKMETNISATEKQKMIDSLGMDLENEDPDYYTDQMRDMIDEGTKEDLSELKKKLLRQKAIDDRRVAVIYEALNEGVELKGDQVYYKMLETYPHFQLKLQQVKKKVKQASKSSKTTTIDTTLVRHLL